MSATRSDEVGRALITPAQRRIIDKVIEGKSSAEIARELGLATSTVKTQISDALRRTHSRSRTHLAVRYVSGEFDEPIDVEQAIMDGVVP